MMQAHIRGCGSPLWMRDAAEGAPFIASHIIRVTEHAFDDFAQSGADAATNRRLLGIG